MVFVEVVKLERGRRDHLRDAIGRCDFGSVVMLIWTYILSRPYLYLYEYVTMVESYPVPYWYEYWYCSWRIRLLRCYVLQYWYLVLRSNAYLTGVMVYSRSTL